MSRTFPPAADPLAADRDRDRAGPDAPRVSVVIANWNGEGFLGPTLDSVLRQSLSGLEVIVADDASTDGSCALVEAFARRDGRVRLLRAERNGGPAAARNRALSVARGRWIAVVDSDDLLHPLRLERLVAAAERDGSDIAADDLLIFDDGGRVPPARMLPPEMRRGFTVDAAGWVRANTLYAGGPMLGYLKPILRREMLERGGLRYDESLRIAEDYDFLLRLLLNGARFSVHPDLTYFYRKHAASISHRLSPRALQAMAAANDVALPDGGGDALRRLLAARAASLADALAFEELVAALKARRAPAALRALLRRPGARRPLFGAVGDRLGRLGRRAALPAMPGRRAVLISRDPPGGLRPEVRDAVAPLAEAGFAVELLCPAAMAPPRDAALPPPLSRAILRGAGASGEDLVLPAPPRPGRLSRLAGRPVATDAHPGPGGGWDDGAAIFTARHAHGAALLLADGPEAAWLLPYALRPATPCAVLLREGDEAPPAWAGTVLRLRDGGVDADGAGVAPDLAPLLRRARPDAG